MKLTAFTKWPLLLLVVTLATLSSCKKDDDDALVASVQSISGSYKLGAMTYKDGNNPEEDLTILFDACELDDVMNLKNDKTYHVTDAGTVCVPPGDYDGNWDVPTSTKFVIDGDEWVIDSYDGKVLKVSQTFTSGGVTEVTKMTLNKQ
jgi:hypothetical protein